MGGAFPLPMSANEAAPPAGLGQAQLLARTKASLAKLRAAGALPECELDLIGEALDAWQHVPGVGCAQEQQAAACHKQRRQGKEGAATADWAGLPEGLAEVIVTALPEEAWGRARLVCKDWAR